MLIEAYQIAEEIQIKALRTNYEQTPALLSSWDIFYVFDNQKFIHILNYGVLVFVNFSKIEKDEFLKFSTSFLEKPLQSNVNDDFTLLIDEQIHKTIITNNTITIKNIDYQELRIITLNLAQSVALDYYDTISLDLLKSTKTYIDELENFGKVRISKKNLLKVIGKIKNIKNSILDNLYILDDPNIVWDNEDLEKVNRKLKENFDIKPRFRDLDYRLKIIEDNLVLFTDIIQHRESARLEWIIIALILVEVLNVFFSDWLKVIFSK